MKITGEKLIDLLYFCEESSEIQILEKYLEIPRPTLGKEFKKDGYIAMESKSTNSEVYFSDISKFNLNVNISQNCLILFSKVFFSKETTLPIPFDIKIEDSLDTVIQKIGMPPHYINKKFPRKTWELKRTDGKDYLLSTTFSRNDNSLVSITLGTYDNTIDLLNNEFHIKNY